MSEVVNDHVVPLVCRTMRDGDELHDLEDKKGDMPDYSQHARPDAEAPRWRVLESVERFIRPLDGREEDQTAIYTSTSIRTSTESAETPRPHSCQWREHGSATLTHEERDYLRDTFRPQSALNHEAVKRA
eukprot:2057058-Rhodomonas_salina.5